jgi:hypothetical protein
METILIDKKNSIKIKNKIKTNNNKKIRTKVDKIEKTIQKKNIAIKIIRTKVDIKIK